MGSRTELEGHERIRKDKATKQIKTTGFVCLGCNIYWRDDNFHKEWREFCPICERPRDMGRELTLHLGEE